MRILVIGDIASVHIYNFIRYTILEMPVDEVILFNTNNDVRRKANYIEYYQKNNIRLFAVPGYFENLASEYTELKRIGYFDVCHLHFLNVNAMLIGKLIAKYCNVIISNYWGSDWLRVNSRLRYLQGELLDISDYIVSDSRQICCQLGSFFCEKYSGHVRFARFKDPVIEIIKQKKLSPESVDLFRIKYRIPSDKITLSVGYSGSPAHQHLKVIQAVKQLPVDCKASLFIIIPTTYGLADAYSLQLEHALEDAGIPFLIVKDFLCDLDIACLRSIIDIFINTQVTDAYSNTILEYSYLNKVIINGSWLDYSDLEKLGAYYERINSVADLSGILYRMLQNLEGARRRVEGNQAAVELYQSASSDTKVWQEMCFTRNQEDGWGVKKEILSEKSKYFLGETLKSYYMKQMLCFPNLSERIKSWLARCQLNRVAIYGAGDVGYALYQQLKESLGEGLFLADQAVRSIDWYPKAVLLPESLIELQPDALLITPAAEAGAIKGEFAAKFNCTILTLPEWIDELKQEEIR